MPRNRHHAVQRGGEVAAVEQHRRERAAHDLSDWFGPTEVSDRDPIVVEADDTEVPFRIAVRGRASALGRDEGDGTSLPIGLPLGLVSSVASLSARTQPVVITPLVLNEETRTFTLPPGTKVGRLPDPISIASDFGSVDVSATTAGNKVVVKTRVAVTKGRIEPTEYPRFRQFCQVVDAALAQRLVVASAPR